MRIPILLIVLAGCTGPAPDPEGDPPIPPAARPASDVVFEIDDISDPDDQWTTGMARREYGWAWTATVMDARVARHDGFDRLVLEFASDTIPTYHVEFIQGPAVQCGSAEQVEGDVDLVVG